MLVNLRLMSHPLNWVYVGIVLTLWALAAHVVLSHYRAATENAISPD